MLCSEKLYKTTNNTDQRVPTESCQNIDNLIFKVYGGIIKYGQQQLRISNFKMLISVCNKIKDEKKN